MAGYRGYSMSNNAVSAYADRFKADEFSDNRSVVDASLRDEGKTPPHGAEGGVDRRKNGGDTHSQSGKMPSH